MKKVVRVDLFLSARLSVAKEFLLNGLGHQRLPVQHQGHLIRHYLYGSGSSRYQKSKQPLVCFLTSFLLFILED
jgi:hypothetical protein